MREPLKFSGTMPANILPFTADLAIDEAAYRGHLRWLADTRGVTGIVANGHAAEVSSLTREGYVYRVDFRLLQPTCQLHTVLDRGNGRPHHNVDPRLERRLRPVGQGLAVDPQVVRDGRLPERVVREDEADPRPLSRDARPPRGDRALRSRR